jgi:DNA ligase-1
MRGGSHEFQPRATAGRANRTAAATAVRARGRLLTVLFADLVAATEQVAATSSRTGKRDALAAAIARMAPDEVAAGVGMLMGAPRQGRVGVGWATVGSIATSPKGEASLTILDVDRVIEVLAATSGPGSNTARADLLADLFGRATEPEADFLRRLLLGELRQGALEGVLADAVAAAAQVPIAAVRRAAMLRGDLRETAAIAMTEGRAGLDRVGLSLLHPIQPMLASTATDVEAAVTVGGDAPVSVEWKLDGARVQIHRDGDAVRIFSRNLNDLTERLPEVVELVRGLPAAQLVLDAEVLSVRSDERPFAFQDTMSRFGRSAADSIEAAGSVLRPFFFDLLHLDGEDLLDQPLRRRLDALDEVASVHRIPGVVTADPAEAEAFLAGAIAAGHEGVMVKDIDSAYQAGRRGKTWRKVKPVHLFDLVVLAAEWGHGRRRGWLSNLHLGARDPIDGSFVMVGKTFKGLTDGLLEWQTAALLEREVARDGITVHVRPELVVEIALDGVQASTRYAGGVALRFARVRRYREDKPAAEIDTIDALRALLPS